ncbi:MAG: ABC transporter ATP-binding protein [Rhodothermales bacterium]|nr:ABC transporter ATP-binding protein [Rhodothermales bacterium]
MNDGVDIQGVTKRFGKTIAVNDVSLHVSRGEFVSLLGPSGCGKTTLLRLIAGFENPDSGKIFFEGKDSTALSPQKRPSAMVFQNYALFPHMTVAENVAYGLKVRRVGKAEITNRVKVALEQVDLSGSEKKPVTQLSGGQQQRVALARAVAVEPDVILFDEPLSNLDVALRERTRNELRLLQKRIGMTSIYVTHDQEEALSLSDRIAVMQDGKIIEVGSPEVLYSEPITSFVAGFLGGANLVSSPVVASSLGFDLDPSSVLAIRAEDLKYDSESDLTASVTASFFHGAYREVWLDLAGQPLRANIEPEYDIGETFPFVVEKGRIVKK